MLFGDLALIDLFSFILTTCVVIIMNKQIEWGNLLLTFQLLALFWKHLIFSLKAIFDFLICGLEWLVWVVGTTPRQIHASWFTYNPDV